MYIMSEVSGEGAYADIDYCHESIRS
jgi:hypothetical protein